MFVNRIFEIVFSESLGLGLLRIIQHERTSAAAGREDHDTVLFHSVTDWAIMTMI